MPATQIFRDYQEKARPLIQARSQNGTLNLEQFAGVLNDIGVTADVNTAKSLFTGIAGLDVAGGSPDADANTINVAEFASLFFFMDAQDNGQLDGAVGRDVLPQLITVTQDLGDPAQITGLVMDTMMTHLSDEPSASAPAPTARQSAAAPQPQEQPQEQGGMLGGLGEFLSAVMPTALGIMDTFTEMPSVLTRMAGMLPELMDSSVPISDRIDSLVQELPLPHGVIVGIAGIIGMLGNANIQDWFKNVGQS
jgi:hypothetical protein